MYVTCDDHIEVGILLTILSLFQSSQGEYSSPQDMHGASLVFNLLPRQTLVTPCLPGPHRTVALAFPFDAECLSLQPSLLLLVRTCSVVSAVRALSWDCHPRKACTGWHTVPVCEHVGSGTLGAGFFWSLLVSIVCSPPCSAHPHDGSLLFWKSSLLIDP